MTLDDLNRILTERGIRAAIKYAKTNGDIHYKETLKTISMPVKRFCLHVNDDGTAYISLHCEKFNGQEKTS